MIPKLVAEHPVMPPEEIIAKIEEALERDGTHTWEDVQELLIRGDAQIFSNAHGAWITLIKIAPRRRWLDVWIVAGQLPGVMELQDDVERFCLTHGLDRMVAIVRPGWVALTEKEGWEKFGWREHGSMIKRTVEGV